MGLQVQGDRRCSICLMTDLFGPGISEQLGQFLTVGGPHCLGYHPCWDRGNIGAYPRAVLTHPTPQPHQKKKKENLLFFSSLNFGWKGAII